MEMSIVITIAEIKYLYKRLNKWQPYNVSHPTDSWCSRDGRYLLSEKMMIKKWQVKVAVSSRCRRHW